MTPDNAEDFIHPELNHTVRAIGGEYVLVKEAVLPCDGADVLYLVGCALFDTTCCGAGGVCYARVAGYLLEYQYKTDAHGRPVSRVIPITDGRMQKEIRRAISEREPVQQVEF